MKMKNIFIILYILGSASISLFSQYNMYNNVELWSTKKWATAGIYESYSDKMKSSRIYEITNGLASLGYAPVDKRDGDRTMALEGFFGTPVGKKNVYLALAFAYDPSDNYFLEAPKLNGASNVTSFVLRPVIRFTKSFAIEYMFTMHKGFKQTTTNDYTGTMVQKHQAAISASFGNVGYLNIPASVSFETRVGRRPALGTNEYLSSVIGVRAEPEFYYKIEKGALRALNFGFFIDLDIMRTETQDEEVIPVETIMPERLQGGFSIRPEIRWKLKDDKVFFGLNIEFGAKAYLTSTPIVNEDDIPETYMDIRPYVSIPFGTIFKLGEYAEFRMGFRYDFEYSLKFSLTPVEEEIDTEEPPPALMHRVYDNMSVFTGFGINAGKDANLDFMVSLSIPGGSSSVKKVGLESFGFQASYRF